MRFLLLMSALLQTSLFGGLSAQLVSSVEAHGPLARLALDTMGASGRLQYYPASAARAAVPVAATLRAAPLTHVQPLAVPAPVAAVDVVHHVPSVAEVPVTKYSTYPGYIQRLVDVPTPKIAKAKLQVRRPAIQKQFYDIEERTVVRPVGSAVVELDEPVSKNLVSPFTVVPGGYHTVAQYQPVVAYPSNPYPFVSYPPFQTPVQGQRPVFVQQYPQLPQQPVLAPQPPQQYPQLPPGQQPVLAPLPPQQYPIFPPRPQQPSPPVAQPPQQFPQPQNPNTENVENTNEEFDDSDTVVIENPDFARSRVDQNNEENESEGIEKGEKSENTIKEKSFEEDETVRSQMIVNEFQTRQLLRQYLKQNDLQPHQLESFLQAQQSQDGLQEQITKADKSQDGSSQAEAKIEHDTAGLPGVSQQNFLRASIIPPQTNGRVQLRTYSSEGQIASVRNLSPEEYQDNQLKLIELLTGRGEVTEVGTSRSSVKISPVGDAGVVRGRVLTVTSAPEVKDQGTERVSTRRVVVSRPIQTLEEVDVQQPFTKVERVAVHEPALLKAAHPAVARVPTSVPVVSRTYTPAAAPLIYH